jgi:hypothetical protein
MNEKEAQAARSQKYGIAVRDNGHVTKPAEFASVPDDEWLDPVNYAYPCPDAAHTASAASYWDRPENRAEYDEADQMLIEKRLRMMEERHKVGEHTMTAGEELRVSSFSRLSAAQVPASPDYGYKWHVQIVESGVDRQGIANYSMPVLAAAAPVYEGARVFALTQGQHDNPANPYGKSVRDLVGWLSDVRPTATALEGTLNILKSASWLRDMAVDAFTRGKRDLIGLSHDVVAQVAEGGKSPKQVQRIVRVDSVDVVYDPIAGGKLLRVAAAGKAGQKEGVMWKQLLAALKSQRPDLKEKIEALEAQGESVTEEAVQELVLVAAGGKTQKDDVKEYLAKLTASLTEISTSEAKTLVAKAEKTFDDAQKLLSCATVLVEELRESNLPDLLRKRVENEFSGKVFEPETLRAAIKEYKEIADKLTGSGAPNGVGGLRISIGTSEPEKLQAAIDKMLGADTDEKFKDVPAFQGLRSAYTQLTGDDELRGVPSRDGLRLGEAFMQMMRLPAAYRSNSFSYVLGVSMFKRLLKEYRAVNYFEEAIISYYRNAENFKTLEIINVGYFGDVPDVDPETADYVEITMPTDVEATYSINQKGWILTVTRKVILNDDLKTITQLVSKMGRAHRRTHAKRAWNKIINNATYKGDSVALFADTEHGNLGTVALTLDSTGIATLTNRFKAMYAQEEQDSGESLALVPRYLWCPRDALETAQGLNSAWPGAATPNPHAGKFGSAHERIICNPLFVDTNDWGLIADATEVELLEVAYINGRREPEFFVADNPLVGQMFVADKIQYKSRHEYEFEIADYRGFDKSVVSGGT